MITLIREEIGRDQRNEGFSVAADCNVRSDNSGGEKGDKELN